MLRFKPAQGLEGSVFWSHNHLNCRAQLMVRRSGFRNAQTSKLKGSNNFIPNYKAATPSDVLCHTIFYVKVCHDIGKWYLE
jgi:hypothetical protein